MQTQNATPLFTFLALSTSVLIGLVVNNGCANNKFLKRENNLQNQIETAEQAQRDGSNFWLTSHEFATNRAKAEKKLLMAHFTGSDWCTWCVKLEDEVFDTPEFKAWSSKFAVPLKLDYPRKTKQKSDLRKQNKQVLLHYEKYVKGYPTVLFLDERGEVVTKMGYVKGGPDAWIAKLESKLGWDAE